MCPISYQKLKWMHRSGETQRKWDENDVRAGWGTVETARKNRQESKTWTPRPPSTPNLATGSRETVTLLSEWRKIWDKWAVFWADRRRGDSFLMLLCSEIRQLAGETVTGGMGRGAGAGFGTTNYTKHTKIGTRDDGPQNGTKNHKIGGANARFNRRDTKDAEIRVCSELHGNPECSWCRRVRS